MALIRTDNKHYYAIARKIRNQLGLCDCEEDSFLPEEMAGMVEEVGRARYEEGHLDGWNEAHEGISDPWDEGYNTGFDEGYDEAYNAIQDVNDSLEQTLYGTDADFTLEQNVQQAASDFRAIKDKMVEKGVEIPDETATSDYASKLDEVYDNGFDGGHSEGYNKGQAEGYTSGKADGVTEGIEQGKQAERTAHWNLYQNNGARVDYDTAYAGYGWDNTTFKPEHDMRPTTSYMMFRQTRISGDLVQILAELGVTLDFSVCTNGLYTFSYMGKVTRVGVVNLSKIGTSAANSLFEGSAKLKTIDEIILPTSRVNLTYAFSGCTALEDITFSGGKIQYNINFKNSKKLTVASAKNIILALADFAGTANEYSYEVAFAGETVDLLAAEGDTSPSGGSWVDYITEKGWNS